MTEKQMLRKVKKMLKEHEVTTLKEVSRLFNSGGVDTSKYEDNYLLPKILLHVALLNEAHQYRPLDNEGKKTAKNLTRF